MCQSIAKGGRRCNSSLSGYSNYPHALSVSKAGEWNYDAQLLSSSGALMSHAFIVAARTNQTLPAEVASLSQDNAHLWEKMDADQKWRLWRDVSELDNPSEALVALHDGGWESNFPALANIRDVPQSAQWHPEGAVHVHSQQAADVAAKHATRDALNPVERQIAVLGSLAHDFGKATHSQVHADGRITAYGHNASGVPVARKFLKQINAPEKILRAVPALVKEHMCHSNPNPSAKAILQLEERLEERGATFDQLMRVVDADTGGRGSASAFGVGDKWRERLAQVKADRAKKARSYAVNGDMLREMGLKPGHVFGELIGAYRASGQSLDRAEAEAWVNDWLAENPR